MARPFINATLSLSALVAALGSIRSQAGQIGTWEPAVTFGATATPVGCGNQDEIMFAIHAHVIPAGPKRGRVLFWDRSASFGCFTGFPANGDRDQRWGICDPETGTVEYFSWTIPHAAAPQIYSPLSPPFAHITQGGQGIFCAGHCWLPDGRLFVVGGDDWTCDYNGRGAGFTGSRLVAIWDPVASATVPQGVWSTIQQVSSSIPFLKEARWYPSVVVAYDPLKPAAAVKAVILGGVEETVGGSAAPFGFRQTDRAYLTHEAYDIVQGVPLSAPWTISKDQRPGGVLPTAPTLPASPGLFVGPQTSAAIPGFPLGRSLYYYSRSHYMSDAVLGGGLPNVKGNIWCGSMPNISVWIDHIGNPNFWPTPQPVISTLFDILDEATFAVLPASMGGGGTDRLALFGGEFGRTFDHDQITTNVFVMDAKQPAPAWSATVIPPMHLPRKFANAVVLPNRTVLIVGGSKNPVPGETGPGVKEPEVFDGSTWTLGPPESSPRGYHSCALLLPSGKVVTLGGEGNTSDMQVFVPKYTTTGRPTITTSPATIGYTNPFTVTMTLSPHRSVVAVSLTSPGSVTHSFDPNQRIVELNIVSQTPTTVTITPPSNPTKAPYGHYMLWLEDSSGDVSAAAWVQLL
jgi:hypothetical protein